MPTQGAEFRAKELLKLAESEFGDLTDADRKLFDGVALGDEVELEGETIDADRIAWLCIDADAARLVTPAGISITEGTIDGTLNLSHATVEFPLGFYECTFEKQIELSRASLVSLFMIGGQIPGMRADGLNVKGDLFLRNGFKAKGEVRLLGAKIGGSFECNGAEFENRTGENEWGIALGCDGMDVTGGVFLKDGFKARGEVRLAGAKIGGNLECDGSEFEKKPGDNRWGDALGCYGMEVVGNVFLRDGFKAKGEVNLVGAKIGGDLDCSGGDFINPNWSEGSLGREFDLGTPPVCALNLRGAEIGENIIIRSLQSKENGTISFLCQGRIDFQSAICKKVFALRKVHKDSKIELDLRGAKVGVYRDDKDSWERIVDGGLHLDGFVYDRFYDESGEADGGKIKKRKGSILPAVDRLKWLAKQGKKRFLPQPYKQLAKVYRESGHSSDETSVLIACENKRLLRGQLGVLDRLWRSVLGVSTGYGHRPSFTLFWMAMIVLGGMQVFNQGILEGPLERTADNVPTDNYQAGTQNTFLYSLVYSLDVFLPVVDLHVADKWKMGVDLLDMKASTRWHVPVYYWFEIIMGWLLTTLLIASLTGLMQRRE